MVAWGVSSLVDASTVAIKLAIFSGDQFPIVLGVHVDGALGVSGGDELGSLVEVDGVLVGEDRWALRECEGYQVASKENFNKVRHILIYINFENIQINRPPHPHPRPPLVTKIPIAL